MSCAILIPSDATGDEWRARALVYVTGWYAQHFPKIPVIVGTPPPGEWSKGAAIADAVERAGDVAAYVLADGDSFMLDPMHLHASIDLVTLAGHPWAIPHENVYRLRAEETDRLHGDPKAAPRLGHTARPMYEGPIGGGISVVSRAAFETVRGIDRRFLGWGGEDVAFGWALQTLTGTGPRLEGRLVHLWHPHPAPNLRGSAASEALVATYREARGVRRRMAAVVAGETWEPAPPLAQPVRFLMTANRTALRLPSGELVKFRDRRFETSDPDTVEQLRSFTIVREDPRR